VALREVSDFEWEIVKRYRRYVVARDNLHSHQRTRDAALQEENRQQEVFQEARTELQRLVKEV
jgi:hypothetical protein